MTPGGVSSGNRLDAQVGYGLPVGRRFVGTPRFAVGTSAYGRDYRLGYGLGVLNRESLNFELGVDAQRREGPRPGGTDTGVRGQARPPRCPEAMALRGPTPFRPGGRGVSWASRPSPTSGTRARPLDPQF